MRIRYELNPPKILYNNLFDYQKIYHGLALMNDRIFLLKNYINHIHITDSVLGIPRISSITAAYNIKEKDRNIDLSCSVRTRDRNIISMYQLVSDAIVAGIESLLLVQGDEPLHGPKNSGLKPTYALNELNEREYNKKIKLNLSIPNKLTREKISLIQKKIQCKPNALVTQSIESINDLEELSDLIKPNKIKLVACIMIPSKKNALSANMIGLKWNEYEREPIDFIIKAGKIADEILLTSPNHFEVALEILEKLKKEYTIEM